jgi:hypothetical protein
LNTRQQGERAQKEVHRERRNSKPLRRRLISGEKRERKTGQERRHYDLKGLGIGGTPSGRGVPPAQTMAKLNKDYILRSLYRPSSRLTAPPGTVVYIWSLILLSFTCLPLGVSPFITFCVLYFPTSLLSGFIILLLDFSILFLRSVLIRRYLANLDVGIFYLTCTILGALYLHNAIGEVDSSSP